MLYIPLTLLIASVGVIMLSAFGVLKADNIIWDGFAGINKLNKLPSDSQLLQSIDESLAAELIESDITEDTEADTTAPIIPEIPVEPPINLNTPVGESADHILKETFSVGDEYFADTLFIGDSRMLGLSMTCQNSKATFYAAVGLSINQLNTKKVIKIDSETSYTVMEAIKNDGRSYKRIYMMFGLNELGWSYPNVFIRSVRTAIEEIAVLCPEAEFCIMGVMPISEDTSVSIYKGAEANARVREYNSLLLQLASEKNCWYLDTYNLFADEYGNLPGECAGDGIHMYSKQNLKLMDYISCHAFAS